MSKEGKVTDPRFKSWQEIENERNRARREEEEKRSQEALEKAQQRVLRLDSYDAQKKRRKEARADAVTKYDSVIREILGTFASVALKPSIDPRSVERFTDRWGEETWSIGQTGVRVVLFNREVEDKVALPRGYAPRFAVYAPCDADKFDMENYRFLAETIEKRTELKSEIRKSAKPEVATPPT
jgi:hypothetical protein